MRCILCQGHASFERTVFRGTSPVQVRLCPSCSDKVRAEDHMRRIKAAPDRDAKTAAISEFLDSVGV